MSATHTPGPWKVVSGSLSGKLAVVGPKNDGKLTTSDRICNLPQRNGEGPHNAHLIAAAPDLLEALEFMVAEFGEIKGNFRQVGALAAAYAAVVKARGES